MMQRIWSIIALNDDGTSSTVLDRFSTKELADKVKTMYFNDPWHEVQASTYEPPVIFSTLEQYNNRHQNRVVTRALKKLTEEEEEMLRQHFAASSKR